MWVSDEGLLGRVATPAPFTLTAHAGLLAALLVLDDVPGRDLLPELEPGFPLLSAAAAPALPACPGASAGTSFVDPAGFVLPALGPADALVGALGFEGDNATASWYTSSTNFLISSSVGAVIAGCDAVPDVPALLAPVLDSDPDPASPSSADLDVLRACFQKLTS